MAGKNTDRVNFKADPALVNDIKALAAAQGLSLTELLIELMKKHVERNRAELQEYYNRQERFKIE